MPESPHANRILLECIAGRDEHARIIVDERPIRIANGVLQPTLAISELTADQGFLLIQAGDGALQVDATNCLLAIYINNREITCAPLLEPDVLRIGNSIWRARYNTARLTTDHMRDQFSHLIGLEELKDFRLADVFSEVFKKHTQEEMEEQLITGTARNTPALEDLSVGWAKPWLFARLLGASALLAFILYVGFNMFLNLKLIPGLIFVGSFAVPISTLIFFLEMNVPRNVSIFRITQLLFFGGIASIIVALIFFSRFSFFSTTLGASAAGIIEESAKILIVALFVGRTTRYNWILNGLLFGAAVGTGFAAFESAGYAFETMLSANSVDVGVAIIMLRGIDAPFTHIVWTANAAAALWIVKGDRPFTWEMLKAPAFLRVFISSVLLHMLWDAPFGLLRLPLVLDLKFVILGILGWIICLRLVQAGLKQLNDARAVRNLPAITQTTVIP
jgi:RsiW-degrading membrane proteinase PrsW (M82 family)